MIIRVTKTADPFARIPKTLINDKRLSMKAKGVLCYLLSKPNDWVVQRQDVINHCTDGRDAIKAAFRELRDTGYAFLVNTKFGREWHVADTPRGEATDGKPVHGSQPQTENPPMDNPPLTKNKSTTKKSSPTPSLLDGIWKERLAAIYGRRKTTKWTADETKALAEIVPLDEEELKMVETYYHSERKKEKNFCRTTLLRLLRHWPSEVDRARAWYHRRVNKARSTLARDVGVPQPGDLVTDEDFKRAGEVARAEVEKLRKQLKPQ